MIFVYFTKIKLNCSAHLSYRVRGIFLETYIYPQPLVIPIGEDDGWDRGTLSLLSGGSVPLSFPFRTAFNLKFVIARTFFEKIMR